MQDDSGFDGEFGEDFIENFFFKTPLYESIKLTEVRVSLLVDADMKVDGYCSRCEERRTFTGNGLRNLPNNFQANESEAFSTYYLRCTRYNHHRLVFYIYISKTDFQKIGQHPSFGDIAIDESKTYSKLLDKADIGEFHKAIGLAAHGVGIGSYVYLRRIFERLIWKRFAEFKDAEGWDETTFRRTPMKEKIELLKNHLPEFLVKNSRIYAIMSLGVHELSETDCLAFFPVLKQSTIWILEQDKKKKEELTQRQQLEAAIAKFSAPQPHSDITLANLTNKPLDTNRA